jgi:MFS family permease
MMKDGGMHTAQRGIFYGWFIVAMALTIIAVGVGLMFSLGVFMEPLEQAFHWSRGEISQASLCAWVAFGLGSFLFGFLSDRYGTRVVVLIGGLMLGGGMLTLSRIDSLWHLYFFYGVLVGGGTGAFMVPLTSTVTCWFVHKRALMVALTNCGIGIGGTLFAPLTRYLVLAFGWRDAFFIYGLLVTAVILPLTWLIRHHPEEMGLQPYGGILSAGSASSPAYAFGEVLTMPALWIIATIHLLCCAAHSGPIFHMVSSAIDTGMDTLSAATLFAYASLASIAGRLGTGVLADCYGSKPILVTWLSMQATAIIFYLFASGSSSLTLVVLYFGFSYGGVMPLYAVVIREYFGARAMGASYGAVFLLSCFGMGMGAWLGGLLFDGVGTYEPMYRWSALFAAAGAFLALWVRPPPQVRPVGLGTRVLDASSSRST